VDKRLAVLVSKVGEAAFPDRCDYCFVLAKFAENFASELVDRVGSSFRYDPV
jgi:hypothetical protein